MEKRIRYQDIKPYSFVASLDDLHGPSSGQIKLPHAVFWAPGDAIFTLEYRDMREQAYQAVLAEGDEEDIKALINKDLLIDLWSSLDLPIPVAKGWEQRFPELRGNLRAAW